mmetsp:Transcript_57729/g.91769  ORF Transcript_57729/g.91769 Transcript_57729/m.91769 type:complete len:224 (+) Transcript_57729:1645-2316(+)
MSSSTQRSIKVLISDRTSCPLKTSSAPGVYRNGLLGNPSSDKPSDMPGKVLVNMDVIASSQSEMPGSHGLWTLSSRLGVSGTTGDISSIFAPNSAKTFLVSLDRSSAWADADANASQSAVRTMTWSCSVCLWDRVSAAFCWGKSQSFLAPGNGLFCKSYVRESKRRSKPRIAWQRTTSVHSSLSFEIVLMIVEAHPSTALLQIAATIGRTRPEAAFGKQSCTK